MLIPHGTLVMIVDGANMQVFRNSGSDSVPKLMPLGESATKTARTSALGTDRPGRAFQSGSPARSSYETTDYHQVEEDRFAEEAAERLNALLKDDVPGILVAAPRTLGVMRRYLGVGTRSRLIAEIDKDYAQRPVAEIATMLERYEI